MPFSSVFHSYVNNTRGYGWRSTTFRINSPNMKKTRRNSHGFEAHCGMAGLPMATPFSYTATGSFELGPRLPLDTLWGWGLQQESRTSWRASQPLKVGFDQCFFGWLGYFSFTITSPCKNWWCFTMFQSNKDINIPIFLIQLKYVIGVICPVCPKWPACFWYPPGSPSGRL